MNKRKENWAGMNWIRPEKRLAIYLRDGLSCVWCNTAIEEDGGVILTLDHIIPVSRGGKNHESNLITSCKRCNSSRGKRGVVEFAKAVAIYLNHEVKPEQIIRRVHKTSRRVLDTMQTKKIIARRNFTQAMTHVLKNK